MGKSKRCADFRQSWMQESEQCDQHAASLHVPARLPCTSPVAPVASLAPPTPWVHHPAAQGPGQGRDSIPSSPLQRLPLARLGHMPTLGPSTGSENNRVLWPGWGQKHGQKKREVLKMNSKWLEIYFFHQAHPHLNPAR